MLVSIIDSLLTCFVDLVNHDFGYKTKIFLLLN